MKILCLSNGHGEDIIAVRIIRELQQFPNPPKIAVLPLVGKGRAYAELENVSIIGPVQEMPSGGFIYMEGQQLWRDIQGGLLQLIFAQWKAIRTWVSCQSLNVSVPPEENQVAILAVGDIVPLLFAWLSGIPYFFVGTAKSEYHLRDENGVLSRQFWWERLEGWSGSVYLPWERWLMSGQRCKAVFPRDGLTAKILLKRSIPARDLGNPMMDGLEPENPVPAIYGVDLDLPEMERSLIFTLLPGSRSPEAYANWEIIIRAVVELIETYGDRKLLFLGAIAPGLTIDAFAQTLDNLGWHRDRETKAQSQANSSQLPVVNPTAATARIFVPQFPVAFTYRNATLVLNQHAFNDFLHQADFAIAMAGTATEQFVGLGKPAIAIPGKGPQFTPAFAEAQRRLLGNSLILVEHPEKVVAAVKSLLRHSRRLKSIAKNGRRRMGEPGASHRIAESIMRSLTGE